MGRASRTPGQSGPPPKLLFLCQTLPYPPDGGVWIRSYHILRLLSQIFDVHTLCFERAGAAGSATWDDSRAGLATLGRVQMFRIPQLHSQTRLLWDHLRSVASGHVYTTYRYESPLFRRALDEALGDPVHVVHADSLDLLTYFPVLNGRMLVCNHHNVESQLLERRAALERTPLRRWYLGHQARLMERAERQWCGAVALNVTVSDPDAEVLRGLAPTGRYVTIPNGVDIDYFRPASSGTDSGSIVFSGGTNWFPNRDALGWFAETILPLIRAQRCDPTVEWIGHSTTEEQGTFGAQGIHLTGYVDDIRSGVRGAACYVVPLRVGGGTRLKILDAWAMGKAVVSTSVGCEGLSACDGDNILIRDEPEAFASAVVQVLRDPGLRERLGRSARATAEREYSWGVIGGRLHDLYRSLLNAA